MSATHERFWRSLLVVTTGTAAAQIIPLLGSLVLARLFAPAEFGLFASWLGLTSLAAVVMTGRYEMALVIEPVGEGRWAGVAATTMVVMASAVLLALVAGICALTVPRWFNSIPAGLMASFIPMAAGTAITQTWQSWVAAEGRFSELTRIRIGQSVVVTGLQIAMGFVAPTGTMLALAHCMGVWLGLMLGAWVMPPGRRLEWPALRGFLLRHRAFPTWALAGGTVNTAASQLPLLVVATRFGAEAAGVLALTLRTLGAPVSLLSASVLDVFKRSAAASFRAQGECRADYLRTFRILVLGAAAVALFLWLSGEWLFVLAFGEAWRQSGEIALWLLPLFALRFVASPLSYMFYIAGRQRLDLGWQMVLLAVTLVTLWSPAQFPDSLQAYSTGYSLMYLVYLVLSYRLSLGARR